MFDDHRLVSCRLEQMPLLSSTGLIIHASAAGHHGAELPWPMIQLDKPPACYDLSYGAAAQPFVRWAETCHSKAHTGLGMLVGQASESFQLWTGQSVSDRLREHTLVKLNADLSQ